MITDHYLKTNKRLLSQIIKMLKEKCPNIRFPRKLELRRSFSYWLTQGYEGQRALEQIFSILGSLQNARNRQNARNLEREIELWSDDEKETKGIVICERGEALYCFTYIDFARNHTDGSSSQYVIDSAGFRMTKEKNNKIFLKK